MNLLAEILIDWLMGEAAATSDSEAYRQRVASISMCFPNMVERIESQTLPDDAFGEVRHGEFSEVFWENMTTALMVLGAPKTGFMTETTRSTLKNALSAK